VPVFALLLGAVLLGEGITMRAVIAAVLIVGGVALGVFYRAARALKRGSKRDASKERSLPVWAGQL
jgi:drug/metabolite transporter (DMT)-like permease